MLFKSDIAVTEPPFELRSSQIADAVIVEAIGEIDMATAPQLAAALDPTPDDVRRMVVDLSGVTFLDSSGLNALVQAQRALAHRSVDLRIVCPTDRVIRKVFEITHLTVPLSVVESIEEALAG